MKPNKPATANTPSFWEALSIWARIGLLSFGGPAGQIALMHRVLVEEQRWLSEQDYLSALNFCMLLPGPEATQLATYAGWRLHGIKGGLAAGILFLLPGAVVIFALAIGYAVYGRLEAVETVFLGVKAAILAVVVEALLRISRRSLKQPPDWLIAACSFAAIYFLGVPFPVIILVAAVVGFLRANAGFSGPYQGTGAHEVDVRATLRTALIWSTVWILPLAAVFLIVGQSHVLFQLALFFSKLAVVTFGGAYSVLAYMAQEVVEGYGWLSPGEMLDALALAETTPGPLILVTEFVGTLTGYRTAGGASVPMALAGAVVTLWATFAPCFLWIFTGAPYIERLNSNPRLNAALAAVTAAVVGVILNLSLWFAIHVLFDEVHIVTSGPLAFPFPDPMTVISKALGLAILAVVLIFILKRGVLETLAVCATAAFAVSSIAS